MAVFMMVMILISALALSLLAMVFKATTSGPKVDLIPLSISISLIFGLPALRNSSRVSQLWEPLETMYPLSGQKLLWVVGPHYRMDVAAALQRKAISPVSLLAR